MLHAAGGKGKDATPEQGETAAAVAAEATDEELERAALLSAWRSRPDDPVSLIIHNQVCCRGVARSVPAAWLQQQPTPAPSHYPTHIENSCCSLQLTASRHD